MGSQARHTVMRMALSVLAALGGFVVAVIVILNLHIFVGLKDGYAASPADVFEWSVLLGVVDIAPLTSTRPSKRGNSIDSSRSCLRGLNADPNRVSEPRLARTASR